MLSFTNYIEVVTSNVHLCFFLFRRQHSRYQCWQKKKDHVQYIMKNTVTTSDRNSNLWWNLFHRFPHVISHNLSHTLGICFVCWYWWVITTQIIINNFASIRESFVLVIHLRFFYCSVTIWLLQHGWCLCWWYLKQNMKFDIRTLFSYERFQLWHNSTHIKETNNCCYASRGYEIEKLLRWCYHEWCQLMGQKFPSCSNSYKLYQQTHVNHTYKFQELFEATTYFFPLRIAQLLDPEF